jgi:hypothetical protein
VLLTDKRRVMMFSGQILVDLTSITCLRQTVCFNPPNVAMFARYTDACSSDKQHQVEVTPVRRAIKNAFFA